jgi:transketolase
MEPTRKGFGQALAECGSDERVVCIGLDISGSITISDFYAGHPERAPRWISMGIAEQSATAAAAGLAREGKLPVLGSYATFSAARNLDQVRVSICYSRLNVLIAGAHAGVSVGPDGATHQALEDLFAMMGLPNMVAVAPCDAIETRKATEYLLLKHVGPKYIRFAREATPIVTDESTPFVFGNANVIRLRHEGPEFAHAFETRLASKYADEFEDLSIIACGPMVPEAMRAAWILKREFGYETRVINMHSLKPIDDRAIVRAAHETGVIVTAEEHQVGALGQRELGSDREPRPLWFAGDHRSHRRQRPLWRFRRAMGTGEGTWRKRRTHCRPRHGTDGREETRRPSRSSGVAIRYRVLPGLKTWVPHPFRSLTAERVG